MSVTMKTLGAIGIILLFAALYLSPFLLGFYVLLYPALFLSFVMLVVIAALAAG